MGSPSKLVLLYVDFGDFECCVDHTGIKVHDSCKQGIALGVQGREVLKICSVMSCGHTIIRKTTPAWLSSSTPGGLYS